MKNYDNSFSSILIGIEISISSFLQYFKFNFSFVIGLYISYSTAGAIYPSIFISNLKINKEIFDDILYISFKIFSQFPILMFEIFSLLL